MHRATYCAIARTTAARNGRGKLVHRATYCAHNYPLPLLPSGPGGVGGITSRRTRHRNQFTTSKPPCVRLPSSTPFETCTLSSSIISADEFAYTGSHAKSSPSRCPLPQHHSARTRRPHPRRPHGPTRRPGNEDTHRSSPPSRTRWTITPWARPRRSRLHRDRSRHLSRARHRHAKPHQHHLPRHGQISRRRRHHQLAQRKTSRRHLLHRNRRDQRHRF